ncbi:MAG: ABC transporter ATP-binding protein [Oscillospiraceae bacterium]|nr:ABC transporter ATP-binding protein [Oscillospiraceae bacterium]
MELRAENIGKKYFRDKKSSNFFYAVRELSLDLRAGTVTEVMGRSGSGKSTMLNMFAGLLTPDEGEIYVDEIRLYSLKDEQRSALRNRCIGVIPQGQTGLHSLTVMENVKLPCMLYGEGVSDELALSLLERVGIADLKDAYPNELSGGEMRRLSIARALIRKPGILLADEPTGDLDDENTKAVLSLLRETADTGTAVLLVTHESEAAAYADSVYRMHEGILTLQ